MALETAVGFHPENFVGNVQSLNTSGFDNRVLLGYVELLLFTP